VGCAYTKVSSARPSEDCGERARGRGGLGRKGLAAMREVVIVALAAFLIAIMVTALLVHFLP
jgi:hypothetical protein